MATTTQPITIHITAGEIRELDKLAKRMGKDRDEFILEIISEALNIFRIMEGARI